MDILAGMLAYVAGIGAVFAALAVSFSVFFATPHESLQTEPQPQNARAMLVRPSTPNKPAVDSRAKQTGGHSEKGAEKHAAGSSIATQATTSARDPQRKHAPSTAQARRLIQEERARHWAYQQDSSFESRFLGYAD
jgi:hypothetical protein